MRRTSVVAPLVGARPPGLNILPGPILNLPIPTPVSRVDAGLTQEELAERAAECARHQRP